MHRNTPMIRRILAFIAAVAAAYIASVLLSAQVALQEVASYGMSASPAMRIETSLRDLAGMLGMYLPLVTVSLAIAVPVSASVLKFVPLPRWVGYVIGGAVGLWALHMIMFAVFGMHALPSTRFPLGMASQVIAGALAGYVFHRLSAPRTVQGRID